MKQSRVRYYDSFTDDFEQSANQDFKLPATYRWVHSNPLYKALSHVIYALAVFFGFWYCRLILHVRIRGKACLKQCRSGCFVFGNHTQPLGDVFLPALCAFPQRIYTVVSTTNYGIPVIGRLLPFLGALPTVSSVQGIRSLEEAIDRRLREKHPIVIYPEAHVWQYYTAIRPFSDTAFKLPVRFDVPSFSMTVTYRKSRLWKRPKTVVFLDGPFYPEGTTPREKASSLHREICTAMQARSRYSNCHYIEYKERHPNR